MKIIADLCIVPMGVGPSVSAYIKEVRDILAGTGLTHEMHANGTNIEGEMSAVSAAVEACCARLHELGVERIFCTMHFSTRTDKVQNMADKLASLA
ncbi:MTH1187 family thiamine-binding protein [Devosia sp.]|uniref:MTH1187 family thiamine-binding protein n=1 Tax=Devosia sp. TaxID=1871048 RepID=UPI001AC8D15D|nr:MTH1187 family thiamine-binding protein [Devosia sp.]MBN9333406.1 MTH1187 family thiamine-binding protein [Devosia sp.]